MVTNISFRAGQPNERCCSQRHWGTLCNCAVLRTAPFTANLFEPLQQNAALAAQYQWPLDGGLSDGQSYW